LSLLSIVGPLFLGNSQMYMWCLKRLELRDSRTGQIWILFSVFIGLWDFVSDLTMLALISPLNPYGLFWISLGSILMSIAASGFLSSLSSISASWRVKFWIFVTSCGNLFKGDPVASNSLCFKWSPENTNHVAILAVEQVPQLFVQGLLVYLQGLQGFTTLDWVIWGQSAFFTVVNALKNIVLIHASWKNRIKLAATDPEHHVDFSNIAISGAGGIATL
jgi:hypothetical protein